MTPLSAAIIACAWLAAAIALGAWLGPYLRRRRLRYYSWSSLEIVVDGIRFTAADTISYDVHIRPRRAVGPQRLGHHKGKRKR